MRTPRASRLGRMDLNLLHVFDVVYRERSVSRAAAILAVSQSAVSHSLARLRAQLGGALFEQKGRGLVPTAMADRIAPGVEAALGRLDGVLLGSQEFDPQRDVPRATLAVPGQREPLVLPEVVRTLRQRAPGIDLRSVRLDRARLKKELQT